MRGLQDLLHRIDKRWVLAIERRRLPHRIEQVVRANKYRVDAGHAENFIRGFDRLHVLDHDDNENLFVRFGIVGGGIGVEIRRMKLPADGAVAQWLIARGVYDRFGFESAN